MRSWLLALVLGAVAACPLAPSAFGRAGGGDSYSGSSSRSSGSSYSGRSYSSGSSYSSSSRSGSGGGGGGGTGLSGTALVVTGLVLLVLFPLAAVEFRRKKVRALAAAESRRVAKEALARSVRALPEKLPWFSEEKFLKRVEETFQAVQAAWSSGDMAPAASLVSDGVFERFQLLLELQHRAGKRNVVDQVSVKECEIAQVRPGERHDVIDVKIRASCRDRYLSVGGGRVLKSSEDSFVEYWSFARNGAKDWVVAEITQASAWKPAAGDGAEAPLSTDPGATAQVLEDRASVLFWRWQRCLADGDAAALLGLCSEAGVSAVLASGVGRVRYEDCGVGSVAARAGESDAKTERVAVTVLWAGRRADQGGKPGKSRRWRTALTLARDAGARTPAEAAFQSAHCARCRAALQPADAHCPSCKASLNDPSVDWVLVGLATAPAKAAEAPAAA